MFYIISCTTIGEYSVIIINNPTSKVHFTISYNDKFNPFSRTSL